MDRTIETTAEGLPELIRKYRLAATEPVRLTFEGRLTENDLNPGEEDDIPRADAEDKRSPVLTNAQNMTISFGAIPSDTRLVKAGGRITRPHYTLDALLAGMTPEREHVLDDDGAVGAELI